MNKLAALSDPFPPEDIHWRVQGKPFARNGSHSAMALAYLDARDVMDRLDAVCGPDGWQSHFEETAKGRIICRLSIRIGDEWVTKSDGAGDTDVEGEKGALSDALKRAAVSWGIGRYLYRLASPWVACEVNDKGAWKRWAEDPWSKVKGSPAPPRQPNPPKPQKKPPPTSAEIADRLIKRFGEMQTLEALLDFTEPETVSGKAWDDLAKNHGAEANRVKAAFDKRKSELEG